jgi:hypothetical protein
MATLEEQFNEQILNGTVPVNDQNLQQALIETAVLDDLNDVNISIPTDNQILGYNSVTNSWQNTNAAIANGDKGDITTSGGGSTWTIDNDVVTNSKLANMATARVKGRATAGTGDPEDLVIDNDLSTVSASDDTIPSAKAVKDYVDILELKTRIRNGGLINGFIRVTVASNNLTVAISTSPTSQVDPTATNPVYVWIGDTLRSITSAMNSSISAGFNTFNAGSAELATKEIDYFAYIGKATSGGTLSIGFGRIPYAKLGSDFNTSLTNEKFGRFDSSNIAVDNITEVVNIGRFAATLSAGYNWSVPTFDNANLIQEPIYETRFLEWAPSYPTYVAMTSVLAADSRNRRKYTIKNDMLWVEHSAILTLGGTANIRTEATLPFTIGTSANQGGRSSFTVGIICNVGGFASGGDTGPSNVVSIGRYDSTNLTLGNFWVQWSGWANLR